MNRSPLPRQRLADGAATLGIFLDEKKLDTFEAYAALLAEGRMRQNLTTIVDPIDVVDKLFLDSLTAILGLPADPMPGARFLDVGTGAGFPGVPLAIALPHVGVTLLDATARKAAWVDEAVGQVGLENAWGIPGRAEEFGHHSGWRGRFDVAMARAVAPLSTLAELLLPFVRRGGIAVALKTSTAIEHELRAAEVALDELGGKVGRVVEVPKVLLPRRVIVTFVRTGETPPIYPRRPGIPAQYPLGVDPSTPRSERPR